LVVIESVAAGFGQLGHDSTSGEIVHQPPWQGRYTPRTEATGTFRGHNTD
jgi:hypothetical protein